MVLALLSMPFKLLVVVLNGINSMNQSFNTLNDIQHFLRRFDSRHRLVRI
jgi:hypothetical protein